MSPPSPGNAATSFGTSVWAEMSEAERAEARNTFRRVFESQGSVYLEGRIAVADGALPGGAGALVVQDAAHPTSPIIVLSPAHANEATLASVLQQLTLRAPFGGSWTGIDWWDLGPRETDVGYRILKVLPPSPASSSGRQFSEHLPIVRAGAGAVPIDLPGVGPVRMVTPE
jgi:hypothetical protein